MNVNCKAALPKPGSAELRPRREINKLFRKKKYVKFEAGWPEHHALGFLILGCLRAFNLPRYMANLQEQGKK